MKNNKQLMPQGDQSQRIEELVIKIKNGDSGSCYDLWAEIEDLCNWYCRKLYKQFPDRFLIEYEDLTQCGYLAMIEALEHYDMESAGKFSFYYLFYLTAAVFRENGLSRGGYGIDGKRRYDPAIDKDSLRIDAETDRTGERTGTLLDVLSAEDCISADTGTISAVIEQIYHEQLHSALELLVEALPNDERILIRKKYYLGFDRKSISEDLGISPNATATLEDRALIDLRRQGQTVGLEQYLDSQMDYYRGTGRRRFKETGESSTERLALKRIELEERYGQIMKLLPK